ECAKMKIVIFVIAALCCNHLCIAQTPKRIEHRLHEDSTTFTLSLSKHSLHAGETFIAKIHVLLKEPWEIGSLQQVAKCDCMRRLMLQLPDSSTTFEIVALKESGKPVNAYDSSWQCIRTYERRPFDIIATLKAKKAVKDLGQ